MNSTFNIHQENSKNTNIIQSKNKKSAPISIITGSDSIFIKGKLNDVATSYFKTSQKIQNLYKEKNSIGKTETSKNNSKSKNNIYTNNTLNISIKNSNYENKKKQIKVNNLNDKLNSFHLKPNNNLNSTLNVNQKNQNHTIIVKDEIISYKSNQKNINNLSKENNKNKKSLRQIRQNIKKTISKIVNGYNNYGKNNSIRKNKEKNNKNLLKKNITFCNNYNHYYNNDNNIKKDKSLDKINKKIIKNQNIQPKKALKQILFEKKIEINLNINENLKELGMNKPNTTINKSNISINNPILLNNKNSNNKSSAITTSRTNTSSNENLEKKNKEKKEKITNKLPMTKTNINLLYLIQENNKKDKNNSKEKDILKESSHKNVNSFENIENVLSSDINFLDGTKFIGYDDFEDLNSIVKKLPLNKIELKSQSIFSVNNNIKYDIFKINFNKYFKKTNSNNY